MAKDWFSLERITALSKLKPGAAIHVIGVSGVAMAQMAVVLAKQGYRVSGSDKEFYEPMGSFLKASPVTMRTGYAREHVPAEVDLVVIGNAVSYGNEEVLAVEERNLPYTLFPALVSDLVIANKHSIVVSGTHGKSTTTAMVAYLLRELKLDPSFFVGAAIPGFDSGLVSGAGKISVVEGDEYDSCFFAKVPKFSFYRPQTLIVNAVEYDHADIYPDLSSIDTEFTKLVKAVPEKNGFVLVAADEPHVKDLVRQWREIWKGELVTFGSTPGVDLKIEAAVTKPGLQTVTVSGSETLKFDLMVPGMHNAKNALAAILSLLRRGCSKQELVAAVARFPGARRRQELRAKKGQRILIDDFAHHPTAVRETLAALKAFYPGYKLWAIFEPRSNTSRRKVFQQDYINAFAQADQVIMSEVTARSIDAGLELIEVSELTKEISARGPAAVCFKTVQEIVEYVSKNLPERSLVVVMSNGGFGGLVDKLEGSVFR